LAALVEDVEPTGGDGAKGLRLLPSWRTNIAKRLERGGGLRDWDELMTMPRERFVGRRPNAHYAQARSIMLFLHEAGRLGEWYEAYVEGFEEDESGRRAIEAVFESPLREVERRYRLWLRELPEVAEEIRPGMASLGVVVSPGRGDGPEVQMVEAGTGARRAGLRRRDVILSVDGRSTRTMEDLVRILSEYEPGERVSVEVRRARLRMTVEVELTAQKADS
ncbi:MAG: PDZ domain-containing protein, partial [Planctomycetota bacterium]|nr:PDZ domain-containing protein [Planctomycetota bacterium]